MGSSSLELTDKKSFACPVNDSYVDNLIGGTDQDWIFNALNDVLANPEIGELIEVL